MPLAKRHAAKMAERGKRVEIDLVELEKLASLHPTDSEIASWFKVTTRTIERRKSEAAFGEALERGAPGEAEPAAHSAENG